MSQLLAVITRLQSLQQSAETSTEPPQRFFEVNGEKRCSVRYFDKTSTFELEVYQAGQKPKQYQFDDIDIIAIEIYELLQN